jgi:hypothetical protein
LRGHGELVLLRAVAVEVRPLLPLPLPPLRAYRRLAAAPCTPGHSPSSPDRRPPSSPYTWGASCSTARARCTSSAAAGARQPWPPARPHPMRPTSPAAMPATCYRSPSLTATLACSGGHELGRGSTRGCWLSTSYHRTQPAECAGCEYGTRQCVGECRRPACLPACLLPARLRCCYSSHRDAPAILIMKILLSGGDSLIC